MKYRRELDNKEYVMPHVRYYAQNQADFFRFGLVQGEPLPELVSSDQRLGPLQSLTLGATLGFSVQDMPGEWSLRGEYIRQVGSGHPSYVTGVQQSFDLFPPVNIGSFVAAYSVSF